MTKQVPVGPAAVHVEPALPGDDSYQVVFDRNPTPMWLYDINTHRFLAVNAAAVTEYGYPPDVFLALTLRDVYEATDLARFDALVGDAQDLYSGDWVHRRRDGTSFYVEIRSSDFTFQGHHARLIHITNVTARKQADSALREERDRAQQYLDTAEVILLKLDGDGRVLLVNRYACTVLGWTADELLGRNWIETCLPSRIRNSLRSTFDNLVGGDLSIVDNPVVTKSGDERLIEWRNTVLRDDTGQIISTFSCGTDITERSQAVKALQTSEERMRFALEAASVGIWDMDYPTGVLRWSEILETQYCLEPGTFGGTFEAFVDRVHPDDRAPLRATIGKAVKSGGDFSLLHRTLCPDGTVRWLRGAGRVLLDGHGAPSRAVGVSLNVTEHHTLEAQYQQAQKMEAIGRLAGGVAHDFNNLLTVILGFSELLLADLASDDPRHADLTQIQKAGARGAGLTRQLLAFSRKEIIQPTVLDLNALVANIRAMLARLIGEDVTIVLELGAALSPVKADRGQIEQIVVNLAVNARDAMPNGGTLTIATANVGPDECPASVPLAETASWVTLTVSDTGTGMTPEVRAHLFEPFFTTKGAGKGTGLGLATVHGIVTRNGGSVTVDSEVGKGTSFRVCFPTATAADDVVAAAPMVSRRRGGIQTVLVVEDAKGLRELTKRLLERQGYAVLLAANADEALRLFDAHPSIDLLLTDVVMPGASGPELVKQLMERSRALQVIYMSGYTDEAIAHHGVLNPGVAFLHKPFSSETLGLKIREVLDS